MQAAKISTRRLPEFAVFVACPDPDAQRKYARSYCHKPCFPALLFGTLEDQFREVEMAWTAPKIKDIACGMEINMYQPGEDEERGHDHEPI